MRRVWFFWACWRCTTRPAASAPPRWRRAAAPASASSWCACVELHCRRRLWIARRLCDCVLETCRRAGSRGIMVHFLGSIRYVTLVLHYEIKDQCKSDEVPAVLCSNSGHRRHQGHRRGGFPPGATPLLHHTLETVSNKQLNPRFFWVIAGDGRHQGHRRGSVPPGGRPHGRCRLWGPAGQLHG